MPPPWSAIGRAKRGREPLLIRISAQTDFTYTRLGMGQSRPRSPIGRRKRGREAPLIRFLPRKGRHSHSRLDAFGNNRRTGPGQPNVQCSQVVWLLVVKEKGEGGGRFAVVVGPLFENGG